MVRCWVRLCFHSTLLVFFAFDFTMRVLQPRYAPSLLFGRFFVQNQTPEYVGAEQKRFAWALGFILAWPMFYYLVIAFEPNPIKALVCLICMILLFLESAFSICLGCKIFNFFKKEKATNCPGGVCEMKIKEPIQTFSPVQKLIVFMTVGAMIYGIYAYMTKLEDRTFMAKMIKRKMMSKEELQKLEDKAYQKEMEEFDKDDDF